MPTVGEGDRRCTTCGLQGDPHPPLATIVVEARGMQWFECGKHKPDEHPEGPWTQSIPLEKWKNIVHLMAYGFRSAKQTIEFRSKVERARRALEASDQWRPPAAERLTYEQASAIVEKWRARGWMVEIHADQFGFLLRATMEDGSQYETTDDRTLRDMVVGGGMARL